jgi:hypothetical protein
MFGMAVGEMGIQPSDFWRMSPSEFIDSRIYYYDKQVINYRSMQEQSRFVAYWSAFANLRKGLTIEQFKPFPWDKKGIKRKDLLANKHILAETFPKTL